MGSSSGTNSSSPRMPDPKGSTTTPYGNATPFNPSWVSFLPDTIGEDGRMPMATGLNQGHLDAIRDAPPPPPLSAQPQQQSQDLKAMLAEVLAGKRADQFRRMRMEDRQFGAGGDRGGGYTTSGRGGSGFSSASGGGFKGF